jgi:hypothetical protein
MSKSIVNEPGIIGMIKTTMPRGAMIDSVTAALHDGSDAIRIGVTRIQGDLYVVSGNLTGEEMFDNASGLLSFRELLELFPAVIFNCHVPDREPGWIPLYSGIIQETNSLDRVLTSALYRKNLKRLHGKMEGGDFAYSYAGLIGIYALFRSGLIYFKKKYRFRWVQTYEVIGTSYIASQGLIRQLEACGVSMQVFIQNDEKTIQRLYDAGVRYFITEDPVGVREIITRISS